VQFNATAVVDSDIHLQLLQMTNQHQCSVCRYVVDSFSATFVVELKLQRTLCTCCSWTVNISGVFVAMALTVFQQLLWSLKLQCITAHKFLQLAKQWLLRLQCAIVHLLRLITVSLCKCAAGQSTPMGRMLRVIHNLTTTWLCGC
jgi:hypothetical protein